MEEVCLEMDSSCGSLHQTHSKAPAFRLSFFFFWRPSLSLNQIILPLCFITTGSCVLLCANTIEPRWGKLLNVEFARSRFTDSCICLFCWYLPACWCLHFLWTDVKVQTVSAFLARWSLGHKVWTRGLHEMDIWKLENWISAGKLLFHKLSGCVSVQCRNQIWSARLVS